MYSSRAWYILYFALLLCPIAGQAVERGDIAPIFALPVLNPPQSDPQTEAQAPFPLLKLSDYHGKVVYLDFWHSACTPCRASLPLLNALRQRLKHRGFEVIGVNVDPLPQQALAFLSQYPVSYPVTSDVAEQTLEAYGLQVFPTAFLIDRRGMVRAVHKGFAQQDMHGIELALEELLTVDYPPADGANNKTRGIQQQRDQHTTIRI